MTELHVSYNYIKVAEHYRISHRVVTDIHLKKYSLNPTSNIVGMKLTVMISNLFSLRQQTHFIIRVVLLAKYSMKKN